MMCSSKHRLLPGLTFIAAAAFCLVLTACTESAGPKPGAVESPNSVDVAEVAPATPLAPAAASNVSPAVSAACMTESLPVKQTGRLTIGTDKPGYPPYIIDDDPTNGKGLESAVAYAIADKLGFRPDQVEWVVVPFNSSYAPGPKDFDFDINQIGITPDRLQVVDFSEAYYHAPQAVVAMEGSKIANATTLAELKTPKLGVQVGTTSLEAIRVVIQPTTAVQVFDDTAAATTSLMNGNIDGLVADLPTAMYLRDAVLEQAKVVGTFAAAQGDSWGLLFEKGSALVPCVNQALADLRVSGRLDEITHEWMDPSTNAPELK